MSPTNAARSAKNKARFSGAMDAMQDDVTIAYLREAVGEQLSNACAEAICRKPKDAIEFIGTYLIEASREFESAM